MKREHFGDASDHFKRSLLLYLSNQGLLDGLLVVPMANDKDPWTPAEQAYYYSTLGLDSGRGQGILTPVSTYNVRRRTLRDAIVAQVAEWSSKCLFVDCDNGVTTAPKSSQKHLSVSDVSVLLTRTGVPFLSTYQSQHRLPGGYSGLKTALSCAGVHSVIYDGTTCSMLFASKAKVYLLNIEAALKSAFQRKHTFAMNKPGPVL